MADRRKRYNVHGHLKGEKRTYLNEWLGYVKDYNSVMALDRARREYDLYVITKVTASYDYISR